MINDAYGRLRLFRDSIAMAAQNSLLVYRELAMNVNPKYV